MAVAAARANGKTSPTRNRQKSVRLIRQEFHTMYAREISAGDDGTKLRHRSGVRRHSFAHQSQFVGAGGGLPFEALAQHVVEKRFSERPRQLGARLAVTAFATIKPDGHGRHACFRPVAIHPGGEFVVGQPDLRHARPPMEPK